MLPFSRNNQEHLNVRSPPEHFAIGYVHNDNSPLGNIALQYVIQNKCREVLFNDLLHFLKIKFLLFFEPTKTILWNFL